MLTCIDVLTAICAHVLNVAATTTENASHIYSKTSSNITQSHSFHSLLSKGH